MQQYYLPSSTSEDIFTFHTSKKTDYVPLTYTLPQTQDHINQMIAAPTNTNTFSSTYFIPSQGRFESISSLDCGKQVNLGEEADIYEIPQEFEDNIPQSIDFFQTKQLSTQPYQQEFQFFGVNRLQSQTEQAKNTILSRSSASLKRVDRIHEKVQHILNHKRENSESKDSSFNKQTVVNSFCASLEQQSTHWRQKSKPSNENLNIIRLQPKSPISEKRCNKKKMFQFGTANKYGITEPKEVYVDLASKIDVSHVRHTTANSITTPIKKLKSLSNHQGIFLNDQQNARPLMTAGPSESMNNFSYHLESDSTFKRKESFDHLSTAANTATTVASHKHPMTPAKKKVDIKQFSKTPIQYIQFKINDNNEEQVNTPVKNRNLRAISKTKISPYPENAVLKQKAINSQQVLTPSRPVENHQIQKISNEKHIMAENNQKSPNEKFRPHTALGSNGRSPKAARNFGSAVINTVSNASSSSELFDENIGISHFRLESELGKGSYASVKLGVEKSTGETFALKIYQKFSLNDPNKMRNVRREITILRKISHPNIIKMPYAFQDKNSIVLVMECLSKQSLHGFLKKQESRKISEIDAKGIFKQAVSGIEYCHQRGIVHRDIKIENILIEEQKRLVKIIDFGFSICSASKLKVFCGTPTYMAPEIVSKTEYCGKKADVWALGIVLYILLCGKFPFRGLSDSELYKKIRCCSFEIPNFLSEKCANLLRRILRFNPSERPDCTEMLQDPWLLQ